METYLYPYIQNYDDLLLSDNDILSPIHVGLAIKSLRNSDFNPTSAICGVIDNSIEAESKKIKISINAKVPLGKRKAIPIQIAMGDDGIGMDPKILQRCLKLGYSGRYDSRQGIGRFGVGMTFGAISLCQRIEVYSREKQGNWNYTFLDISDIDTNKEPTLHPVEQKNLPEEYKRLVGDCGTLVIWSKIDRIDISYDEDFLIHEIGRIYRKFIGQEIIKDNKIITNPKIIDITINKNPVSSHDPLYATKIKKFPDDEVATLFADHLFTHPVHAVDEPSSGEKIGNIAIRFSLLPESWRLEGAKPNAQIGEGRGGSGKSTKNNRRAVANNQGISILRNHREVYYGEIKNIAPAIIPIDRFWGCEIDFDPVLDHWFSVRNIKIGVRPLDDLKDVLKNRINSTIKNNLREKIRERMNKTEQEKNQKSEGHINNHIVNDAGDSDKAQIELNKRVVEIEKIKQSRSDDAASILRNEKITLEQEKQMKLLQDTVNKLTKDVRGIKNEKKPPLEFICVDCSTIHDKSKCPVCDSKVKRIFEEKSTGIRGQ